MYFLPYAFDSKIRIKGEIIMARTARSYARVADAESLIAQLTEKYPDLFWAVRPSQIAVMGVDNQQRSDKAIQKNPAYAKLRLVKGSEKAIFENNNIPTRYIIELYWDEWNNWGNAYRQWILANVLMEITPEEEKRNSPDCSGFKVLLDVCGVNWDRTPNDLPNLLVEDVEFKLDLRPGLDDQDDEHDEQKAEED